MDQYKIETNIEKFAPLGTLLNGGKGSGNFGHSGRPGQVGGSSSSGATVGESSDNIVFSYSQKELYTVNELGFPELKERAISDFEKRFISESEDEYFFRQYALRSYQNTEYKEINAQLRKGKRLEDIKPTLASTFDMTFDNNTIMYRGENSNTNHWHVKPGDPAPKSLTDGIVSTSLIPDVADYFAGRGKRYKTFITLNVERGTNCVIPQLYTSDLKNEAEIAFPPQTKMIVKSVEESKKGSYIIQKIVLDVKKS